MKTADLTDAALDWAVAKAEGKFITRDPMGFGVRSANGGYWIWDENMQIGNHYSPSSLWSQGGPIIEREQIETTLVAGGWFAGREQMPVTSLHRYQGLGPTPLVAAMRCYVASSLGEEVEVPDELRTP
jgi:hypothetical protein